ncbi:MAG: hypothetical protein A2V93_10800 [Ignavibacteria bacterium RBG_16_34_14]|nr:MAG: hypothetical protein A2V93_10800 [Ignavibacteria bacterium RBG_16_34_14]
MLKIILRSAFTLILFTNSFSQLRPESYSLQGDENYLSKITISNPASNSITDIITIGDTVWLGTSRGVSVSFDRGETWRNFYRTTPFGEDGIAAIGYYKGMFWASTVTTVDAPGGGTVPKGTGLKYTTNNGLTWTAVPQPVDNANDTTETLGVNVFRTIPITVAEQNVTFDIAFTPGTVWITSFASGLRKSTDMGQTWQRVILPTDSLNSISPADTLSGYNLCISPTDGNFCGEGWLNYRAFSVIAIDDTTLYVGTANGINKSTDNGISWRKFTHQNQENSISGNFIVALGYNKTNRTVWGSTWRAEGSGEFYAISSSTDGGENWSNFFEDERVHNFGFKSSQVIAASDNGAFRTSNQGVTWVLPNSIVDDVSKLELLTTIFYSASSEGSDIWLGSNDGLVRLRESFGSFWSGEWKIYFASLPLESANDTYCYPNPFSPRQEILKIKYSTGGESKKVTIRILDFSMNVVRTVIQNTDRIKTLDDSPDRWDGRDENGNLVPNGVYFYRIEFDSDNPVYGKIIVLQ